MIDLMYEVYGRKQARLINIHHVIFEQPLVISVGDCDILELSAVMSCKTSSALRVNQQVEMKSGCVTVFLRKMIWNWDLK